MKILLFLVFFTQAFAIENAANPVCVDQNAIAQNADVQEFTQQISDLATSVDINKELTPGTLDAVCYRLKVSAMGNPVSVNAAGIATKYYLYEETLFKYLGIDINSPNPREQLRPYIQANFKKMTCRETFDFPNGGLLVVAASGQNPQNLYDLIANYKLDYKNLVDGANHKLFDWLNKEIVRPNQPELMKANYKKMLDYLTRNDPANPPADDGFW